MVYKCRPMWRSLDLEREELPVYKWYQLWELGKLHGEIIEKIVGNTEQRPED